VDERRRRRQTADSINVTLDGCVDHQEGIADDETHAFFTLIARETFRDTLELVDA
jgi:hypothetical protein